MDIAKDKISKGKQMDPFNNSHRMIFHLYSLYRISTSMTEFENRNPAEQIKYDNTKPYTDLRFSIWVQTKTSDGQTMLHNQQHKHNL